VNGNSAFPIIAEATINRITMMLGGVGTGATVTIAEELTCWRGTQCLTASLIMSRQERRPYVIRSVSVSVTVADMEPESVIDEYDGDNDGDVSIIE
jgi:hypothetical protein